MSNKTLAQIIQNNIRVKNLEENSCVGDIVIYDDESGARNVDIALEIGATYEIFITSAVDVNSTLKYGQQKITLKLIPAENAPNIYNFYIPIHFYEVYEDNVTKTFIHIYKYNTELWTVSVNSDYVNIYKIVKKAV